MSDYAYTPSMRVGEDIRASRFIKISTADDRTWLECDTAGERAAGVSQADLKDPPGVTGSSDTLAGRAGDHIAVYSLSNNPDVKVRVGAGGLSPGVEVATDDEGRAVAAGTGDYVLAWSVETAEENDIVRLWLVAPYLI